MKYEIATCNYIFDNSYENVRLFDNKGEQEKYFNTRLTSPFIQVNFHVGDMLNTEVVYNTQGGDLLKILGSNYLVCKSTHESDVRNMYYFVKKSEQLSGLQVKLQLELDVLQTYMFELEYTDSVIERAHLDRFKKEKINGKYKYNFDIDSLLHNSEPTDELYNNTYVKEFNNMIVKGDLNLDTMGASWYNKAVEIVSSGWLYFIGTDKKTIQDAIGGVQIELEQVRYLSNNDVILKTNLYVIAVPVSKTKVNMNSNQNQGVFDAEWLYGRLYDKPTITIKYSMIPPFKSNRINSETFKNVNYGIRWTPEYYGDFYSDGYTKGVPCFLEGPGDYPYAIFNVINVETLNNAFNFQSLPLENSIVKEFSLENIKQNNLEPKLLKAPYSNLKVRSFTGDGFDYSPSAIENFQFKLKGNVNSDIVKTYVFNSSGFYFNAENLTIGCVEQNDYLCASNSNAYNNFVANNKAHLLSGLGLPLLNMAQGVDITNVHKELKWGRTTDKTTVDVTGTLAPLRQMINYGISMYNLKNTPEQLRTNGFGWISSIANENSYYKIVLEELVPADMDKVKQFLYRYGYSYGMYDNINNFIRTRKTFNYIQAEITNVITETNNIVKEKIKEIYKKGVRYWHIDTPNYDEINYERWLDNE